MINPVRLCVSCALAACFLLASSVKAAIPPAENLLPSDTLLVVTVPDCNRLRAALDQSPQWLLWNDAAMKPFHDKFMANLNSALVAPIEKDLGMKLADFQSLMQGQITFAMTQNGWTGTGDRLPGFVLLLDSQSKSDLLKTNLATLRKKWTEDGKPIRIQTIRGVEFSVLSLSSNDIPDSISRFLPQRQPVSEIGKTPSPDKPSQLVIAQDASLLIVGNSLNAVEPVVAHLTGGSAPVLNDNAAFAADKLAQFRDSPLYYGWFNAKTVFNILSKIPAPEPNPEAPSPVPQIPWDAALSASGAMGLKSAGFAYRDSYEGSQVSFFLTAPEAERIGLFKMISFLPKDANPPVFVPADAVKFWRWRVDGSKSWAALETMLNNISPAALSGLNAIIAMANVNAQQTDPGFDFRKYLIGNLGDDYISYSRAPAVDNASASKNGPSIFLFSAINPDQALGALKLILSIMYGKQATDPREFLGKKIYSIQLRPSPLAGPNAPSRSLYLTASSGYVAVSADSAMIENFLRSSGSPSKPLRDAAGLAAAAQRVGGAGGGLFAYENQADTMRTAFNYLKKQPDDSTALGVASLPKGLRDWMDFSLLPDYDQVSKYFYFSVFGGTTTSDGIYFKAFAPRPPQLK